MTESAQSPLFDLTGKRVYVAGHNGMVGAAIVRRCCDAPSTSEMGLAVENSKIEFAGRNFVSIPSA